MTGKVGRNDPCPCGSGRKYKKCCQESFDEQDFHYRRWRRVEADLIPELFAYAFETLGPEAIEDAWSEFHDFEAPCAYDPESPMNSVFMPWFLFNWIYEPELPDSTYLSETTIAGSLHSDHALSEDEEKLIMSAIQTPYSLCEVVELTPGVGMTLFDLIRGVVSSVIFAKMHHEMPVTTKAQLSAETQDGKQFKNHGCVNSLAKSRNLLESEFIPPRGLTPTCDRT